MDTVVLILGLGVVCGLHLYSARRLHTFGALANQQTAHLREIVHELVALRCALIDKGAVQLPAASPRGHALPAAVPPPSSANPAPPVLSPPVLSPVARPVSVTRDDDEDHTRATVEAPPPAEALAGTDGEPPSTKPSTSRRVAVPFDEQLRRLLERLEAEIPVPSEFEARWLARLNELRAGWNVSDGPELTEGYVLALVRERHHVAADARDARIGEIPTVVAAPLEERPERAPSQRPPPHEPPRPIGRQRTLLGLSDPPPGTAPPPVLPASRSAQAASGSLPPPPRSGAPVPPARFPRPAAGQLPPATPPPRPPVSGRPQTSGTPPVALYAQPRTPAAPVAPSAASPPPVAPARSSAPGDLDDQTTLMELPSREPLAPKRAATALTRDKPTLVSIKDGRASTPHPAPHVDVVEAPATHGRA